MKIGWNVVIQILIIIIIIYNNNNNNNNNDFINVSNQILAEGIPHC